jgi:hypothetical protein
MSINFFRCVVGEIPDNQHISYDETLDMLTTNKICSISYISRSPVRSLVSGLHYFENSVRYSYNVIGIIVFIAGETLYDLGTVKAIEIEAVMQDSNQLMNDDMADFEKYNKILSVIEDIIKEPISEYTHGTFNFI